MADFAIGQTFIKAHRSILLMTPLTAPCRYFPTRDSMGWITRPTLDTGDWARELQTVKQVSFSVDNNDREFRLIGDDGWSDSVTTGSMVSANFDTFFSKAIVRKATGNCPEFIGDYSEEFAIVAQARDNTDFEVFIEMFKELGRSDGGSGNYIYDYAGFNCALRNYKEPQTAEDLINVTFDGKSRGRAVFGRFDAGGAPLSSGAIQSVILATDPATGGRRYALAPADNATDVTATGNITVTYTSDGSTALPQLALGASDGSGFRLEVASSGVQVPAAVSLNAGTGVVTVNPDATLGASTIYRLVARNGAIVQAVDASLVADAAGIQRPLAGFASTFRTAS
ncbi:MAG: Ig-like domain-containing protein [Synechococcaceae cyanobacterium MAG-AL2]|uniref:Ig-like domain-containing protein n=1 Tax=Candidatus Regnicoccus frigidus TaxID=3074015 RepID=UPI00281F5811|nr:Ig-like domain-containing protein [Candidatus Regnicoccus frigidus]MCT4368006.1 Ig-like domain-containing protein [Candidatus Regnicoccus frigidus MAG-AL2]